MKQFRVYKSSAGSGKTTTLVNEYLRICLPNPEKFKNIIALTFTIKATNEMKQRLVETLLNIVQNTSDKKDRKLQFIFDYLVSNTTLNESQIKENSEKLLRLIIHNYSQFSFSTLDSFVVNIVRSFAFELKLPASFDIELNKQIMIDRAIEILFSEIGKNKVLTNYLVQYVLQQVEEEASFKIEKSLAELSELLFESSNSKYLQDFNHLTLEDFSITSKSIKSDINEIGRYFKKTGDECLEIINKSGLGVDDFIYSNQGVFKFFTKLSNQNFSELFKKRVLEAYLDGKWYKSNLEKQRQQRLDSIIPVLTEKIIQVREKYENLTTLKLLTAKLVPLALLGEIKKNIHSITLEEGLVHLSEMNSRISEIVMNEPIPFIYERIGKKYQHFLVDEFQDTSRMQWNNLIPLIENGLSSGYYNMVVGDAKQAIYRWREGDVHQFVQLPFLNDSENNSIQLSREVVLSQHFEEKSLNYNFRSAKKIVEFNNLLFDEYRKKAYPENQKIFENHIQEIGQEDKEGFIRINILEKQEKDNSIFLNKILHNIETAIQHGFKPGDIAILSRKNKIIAEIADFLSTKSYKVITNKALTLQKSDRVRFIISVLRWIVNPSDHMIRFEILSFFNFIKNVALSNQEFHQLIRCGNSDFIRFFQSKGIEIDISLLNGLPLLELVDYLLLIFDLNNKTDQFLTSFLDTLVDFSKSEESGIMNYLAKWDEKYCFTSLDSSTEKDAIKLMSIHRSKGLEFPVVIHAFYGFNERNSGKTAWVNTSINNLPVKTYLLTINKALENTSFEYLYVKEEKDKELDILNLLYVSCTRPEYESYFVIDKKNSELKNFIDSAHIAVQSLEFTETDEICFESSSPVYINKNETREEHGLEINEIDNKKTITKSIHIKTISQSNFRDQKSRIDFGNVVHLFLSKNKNFDSLLLNIEAFSIENELDLASVSRLKKLSTELENHEQIKSFFSDNPLVLNESNILLSGGKIIRPDKVIIKEEKVILLDFKTSEFVFTQEEIEHKYANQVREYAFNLNIMYNKTVDCYLVYFDTRLRLITMESIG